jgi:hypothetical protein
MFVKSKKYLTSPCYCLTLREAAASHIDLYFYRYLDSLNHTGSPDLHFVSSTRGSDIDHVWITHFLCRLNLTCHLCKCSRLSCTVYLDENNRSKGQQEKSRGAMICLRPGPTTRAALRGSLKTPSIRYEVSVLSGSGPQGDRTPDEMAHTHTSPTAAHVLQALAAVPPPS